MWKDTICLKGHTQLKPDTKQDTTVLFGTQSGHKSEALALALNYYY